MERRISGARNAADGSAVGGIGFPVTWLLRSRLIFRWREAVPC